MNPSYSPEAVYFIDIVSRLVLKSNEYVASSGIMAVIPDSHVEIEEERPNRFRKRFLG